MRVRSDKITRVAIVALLPLLVGIPLQAQTDQDWVHGDDYQPGNYGRVRYLENGVTLLRAVVDPGVPPVEEATINSPIFPGDTVWTDYDQRTEVELAGGSLIRADRASKVTFHALPDPYAEFADNTILQLAEGTIQITAFLGEDEEFRIDTPAASIYLLGDGDFRIEVGPQGRTRVTSHRGVVEVVGDEGSVLVRGGMHTEVYAGAFPLAPEPFNTFTTDSFDRWVDEREASYLANNRQYGGEPYQAEVYDELPGEVQPYYRELSNHGQWVETVEYGYVWHASDVGSTWRPYHNGYWGYGPGGYFWISSEPWGWAPYHYGRWDWVGSYGWVWIPGQLFGGAWVAWSWGSAHVGWAPLSYWNAPAYAGPSYYGYYSPHCWTFVNYTHISSRDYSRYAVPLDRVGGGLGRLAVVTRPPRVSPRQLSGSPDWRERAMRQASADSAAQIKNPYRDHRSPSNLRDVESRLSSRTAAMRGRPADRNPTASGASPRGSGARSLSGSAGRTGDLRRDQSTARRAADELRGQTVRPRQYSTPGSSNRMRGAPSSTEDGRRTSAGRDTARANGSSRRGVPDRQSTAPQRVTPRQNSAGDSAERVRDMYRQMSNPPTTRKRTESPAGSSGADRNPARSGSSRERAAPSRTTTRRPASTTTTRSTTPRSRNTSGARSTQPRSGGSKPSAKPSNPRSGGSRPSAKPSNPRSGGSRPSAKPSNPRSGGSRPSAKPSSSRSSGSRPSAKPSNPRSGGSRPSAKPSNPRSGGSRPSAKPSNPRSSGSRPSARPSSSRSSGSRPSGSKSAGSRNTRGGKR